MFCIDNRCSCSILLTRTVLTLLTNSISQVFSPKLGYGNSTAPESVQTEKDISQVTKAPGYLLPLISENSERTEGAQCVTNVECELHTNVYNLNNAYGNQQVYHGRQMKILTF